MRISVLSIVLASSAGVLVESSDIVNTCVLVDKPEPTGPYEIYSGKTDWSYAHLIFGDIDDNDTAMAVLDVLKEKNTKASFFLHTDHINDENRPALQRILADGHIIGSSGVERIDFLYANNTYIEQQIVDADDIFKEMIGYAPDLFFPTNGALNRRGQQILQDNGKTTVMWSAGANGWWFLDNDKPLEETIAALRYTLPEAGGIVQMPTNAKVLEEFLDQTSGKSALSRNFVDYETCTGRSAGGSKSSKTKSAKAKSSKVEHAVDAKAEKAASSSEKTAKSSKVYKSKTVFN